MEPLALVLILLAGPQEVELGQALRQELVRLGVSEEAVLVGREAHDRLAEQGVVVEDLLASDVIGRQLTRHRDDLLALHLREREMSGDVVIEMRLWLEGESERITSIAGEGGNPLPGVLRHLVPLIDHRLPDQDAPLDQAAGTPVDLARLVEREQWTRVLSQLAGVGELSPREHYYRVLAYSRLARRQAALEALDAMRRAHGQHFLVAAAEEVIPPAPPIAPDLPEDLPAEPAPPAEGSATGGGAGAAAPPEAAPAEETAAP